jgi:hypothetical protein
MTAWPGTWDRGAILGAIEQASGTALSADDAAVDTLIAKAQELCLLPAELHVWITDQPKIDGWTAEALVRWARRYGVGSEAVARTEEGSREEA